MVHGLTADLMPNARRLTHLFLRENAPHLWAQFMTGGIEFYIPDEITHLGTVERARWLAEKEANRLARARLFHLDPAATRAAIHAGGVFTSRGYALGASVPPAEYGLIVWAEDVSATGGGANVIACHWQVRDDAVWTAWWSDAVGHTRTLLSAGHYSQAQANAVLETHGVLMYERERLLPYGAGRLDGTPQDAALGGRVDALTYTTIATWSMLSQQLLPTTVIPAPEGAVAGLAPIPGADDSVTAAAAPPEYNVETLLPS